MLDWATYCSLECICDNERKLNWKNVRNRKILAKIYGHYNHYLIIQYLLNICKKIPACSICWLTAIFDEGG